MIHFGKRSAEDAGLGNQSNKGLNRMKREATRPQELTLVRYEDPEEDVISSEAGPDFWNPMEEQRSEEAWDPSYADYSHPDKKDGSKNVFLRFG
ncbi:uncharacterized protein CDAR_208521 [Caerostris darwini]|uniref:Adrenocorticotropic hormone n=1 Tax=Caerostris darwini TaxID=1538125 RepID=A0AAV4W5A2_9ARAC|nr:uncharacterized protein CDAR_208521 [Caerostris darwini]